MNSTDHAQFKRAHGIMTADTATAEERAEAFQIWLTRSEHYIRSTFYLGVCHDRGFGTRKNHTKAFQAYLRAAKDGHSASQHNLYMMYRDGVGTMKNLRAAIRWLREAAANRDTEAIRDLGFCYHEGRGVRVDFAKAAALYKMAAIAGDAKAQWNLACCYQDGDGVKSSQRWHRHWMRKAAANVHEKARDRVGEW